MRLFSLSLVAFSVSRRQQNVRGLRCRAGKFQRGLGVALVVAVVSIPGNWGNLCTSNFPR